LEDRLWGFFIWVSNKGESALLAQDFAVASVFAQHDYIRAAILPASCNLVVFVV
jgi:hypothetical protein